MTAAPPADPRVGEFAHRFDGRKTMRGRQGSTLDRQTDVRAVEPWPR
jgi:hypothetical protein